MVQKTLRFAVLRFLLDHNPGSIRVLDPSHLVIRFGLIFALRLRGCRIRFEKRIRNAKWLRLHPHFDRHNAGWGCIRTDTIRSLDNVAVVDRRETCKERRLIPAKFSANGIIGIPAVPKIAIPIDIVDTRRVVNSDTKLISLPHRLGIRVGF